jgi:pimeloyl-ACP methyl ester carboxylesterase
MRGMAEIGPDSIEYELAEGDRAAPPLLFLHEGLGSIDLWRSFPGEVREATGRTTLVYARAGHGRSSVVPAARRTVRYMHDEALIGLPEVIVHFGLSQPLLIGHSDGASIAIAYAGSGLGPVSGLVLLAPHVFVEDRSIEGIEAARATYVEGDLPRRMARYHDDADATFWGWNRVWLSPEFRDWNIEEYLPGIECPILVVQGDGDAYGTLAQVDAVECGASAAPSVRRLVLAGCGHSPHLERPTDVVAAVAEFVASLQA